MYDRLEEMTTSRKALNLILPVVIAATCWADAVAISPTGGEAGTDDRPFVIGFQFSVSTPINVNGLAYLDPTGAGLAEAHTVGIFNSSNGSLLVSASIPAGSSTRAVNGFRVVPVSYQLSPGTYVMAGQKPTNVDFAIVRASATVSIPGVQYIEEREEQTAAFAMPTTHFALNEVGSFGPSFTVATPAATPVIQGFTNSASFLPVFAPNTYVSIFGSGLAGTSRVWTAADFKSGTQIPTSLDGVTVTVNGTAAYVEYISPTQINIITPNTGGGSNGVPVVVSAPGQAPVKAWLSIQTLAPAFFTWQTGTSDSGKYPVAQHADYSNAGKVGLFPDKPAGYTTPVKPGETIILYGTGFGPTTPAIAPGIMTDKVYPISPLPTAKLGNLTAQVQFAGLIPGLSQLYQFNITVPASAPDGDLPLIVNVNGTPSAVGLITIAH